MGRTEIVTEYVGIENGRVQQVMYRPDGERRIAETRCMVRDVDGRPYVSPDGRTRYYLDAHDADLARAARETPWQPVERRAR